MSEAQARRCTDPAAARGARAGETVIVQEKLDGSCVGVVRDGARLLALGREGRPCAESGNEARRWFAAWVAENERALRELVGPGEALVGEWLALVHGTRYELDHAPFVPFDVLCIDPGPRRRLPVAALEARLAGSALAAPRVVHRGAPLPVADAWARLGPAGLHGAIDPPEGLVYRVEKGADVVLVAKWVRPDKVDGVHLPENSGRPALYHYRPT